VYMRF